MDDISELFDLFGESACCSICLEDITEASRVRCLNLCQHIFHNKCIEKWFEEKTVCPTCRKEYSIKEKQKEDELMNDIDRLFMTWTLVHGILKKINSAQKFNEKKQDIRNLLARFRSLPVDLDTRYSLNSTKQYIANRICRLRNLRKIQIHKQPQIYQWIDKFENHIEFRTLISPLWSM